MGSIPQVCRFLRLFGPLPRVLCSVPRGRTGPRQREHLHPSRDFGCCVVQWGNAPACGPLVEMLVWRLSYQATKSFRLANEKPFHPLGVFSLRNRIRKRLHVPHRGIPIPHRPLHKLWSRPCAELPIASRVRDRDAGQECKINIPAHKSNGISFSSRAALFSQGMISISLNASLGH